MKSVCPHCGFTLIPLSLWEATLAVMTKSRQWLYRGHMESTVAACSKSLPCPSMLLECSCTELEVGPKLWWHNACIVRASLSKVRCRAQVSHKCVESSFRLLIGAWCFNQIEAITSRQPTSNGKSSLFKKRTKLKTGWRGVGVGSRFVSMFRPCPSSSWWYNHHNVIGLLVLGL